MEWGQKKLRKVIWWNKWITFNINPFFIIRPITVWWSSSRCERLRSNDDISYPMWWTVTYSPNEFPLSISFMRMFCLFAKGVSHNSNSTQLQMIFQQKHSFCVSTSCRKSRQVEKGAVSKLIRGSWRLLLLLCAVLVAPPLPQLTRVPGQPPPVTDRREVDKAMHSTHQEDMPVSTQRRTHPIALATTGKFWIDFPVRQHRETL